MNKQGTLFFWNVLLLHERHHNSHYRGLVASLQVIRMFSTKNPDDNPEALAWFPCISPPWCMSKNICDITKWCHNPVFPFLVGKALHMHRRATLICLHTHQYPCWLVSTATHEPCHHFCIPNSEPVTYRYLMDQSQRKIE